MLELEMEVRLIHPDHASSNMFVTLRLTDRILTGGILLSEILAKPFDRLVIVRRTRQTSD
jgi:hypothetical protein